MQQPFAAKSLMGVGGKKQKISGNKSKLLIFLLIK